ncbi:MAG TPA: ribose 5-phosphate isomerase B [Syntrophorhabdaceae bacterium]|nr:ribose 5-phosphate isomerase B [Syntrophorhabdaceae bacterium]HOL05336.1 ribose 5-phosphate isomerase B [Syntrophorhabdaceae bacterium]HON85065.1 ribose 5-phosphate isomerase B [Syntrophorhabdaceae bacterium]HOT41516.1 ribose 5-phosphate isomerase B [Syntrophorhabdaceae bacterium]HPC65814.1 ribose 5-phosphate isomerase B [Syntrophorhabdaceae bacterium]
MNIAIGSDHAGFELKDYIKNILVQMGHNVEDVGTDGLGSVDYPDFGIEVAWLVSEGKVEKGILVCGTGIGMGIVANKVKGIRASLVYDLYTAIQSRKHLDANILVLGGRVTGKGLAEEIVKTWLTTSFEGGRHKKRIEKIEAWEKEHLK